MSGRRLFTLVVIFGAFAPSLGRAADMRQELKINKANITSLRSLFGGYGYQSWQSVFLETNGLHLRLPADVTGTTQTGIYSFFALTGDCEVTVNYELVNVQPPREGYGSGLGLALDAGDEVGRGAIQRVYKVDEGSGYVVQTSLAKGRELKEEYRFIPAGAEQGRIGLRRINKELVFLASDSPDGALEEIDRLPFTDRTIRAVRLFVDAGGSPTAVDVRLLEISLRAEEIAGGKPRNIKGGRSTWWLWAAVPLVGGVVAVWFWRVYQRRSNET